MEKINPREIIERLRTGEIVHCPDCKDGKISTPYDPKISHFFCCDKCDFEININ